MKNIQTTRSHTWLMKLCRWQPYFILTPMLLPNFIALRVVPLPDQQTMEAATISRAPHTCTEACASSQPAGGLDTLAPWEMVHSTHAQDLQASALRVCQVRRHQGLPVPLSGLGWQLLFAAALCPGQHTKAGCFLYSPYFLQCMSSVQRLGCSWPERQSFIAWHWDNV